MSTEEIRAWLTPAGTDALERRSRVHARMAQMRPAIAAEFSIPASQLDLATVWALSRESVEAADEAIARLIAGQSISDLGEWSGDA